MNFRTISSDRLVDGIKIDNLPENTINELAGKSDISHIHDDRYYTEAEVNSLLSGKQSISEKGQPSGYASLDGTGKVPVSQLPASVAGGDMSKSTYDINDNGIVDNSEKLGGELPSYYQQALESGVNVKTVNGESILGAGNLNISAGSSGYASNIYLTTLTSSTVGAYKQLSYSPEVSETLITATAHNNEVLVGEWIYDADVNTTLVEQGNWLFHNHSYINNSNGISYIRFEPFKRTSGGTETVLFSFTTEEINNTTELEKTWTTTQQSFTTNNTDRLGLRVYFGTDANADRIITIKVGDGNAAYMNAPIALRHSQLRARDEANSHPASAITNTPAGNISATNVQDAINELDAEKQPLSTVLTNTTASYTTAIDTRLANTTGTNTGDNAANSNSGLVHTSGDETIGGNKTFTGRVETVEATAVASASTVDLNAINGNFVHITGTTTINSFGATARGSYELCFDSAGLTITNGAIRLPTGANIVTQAGDTMIVRGETTTGDWRVISYQRKDGSALYSVGGGGASSDGIKGFPAVDIYGEISGVVVGKLIATASGTFNEVRIVTDTRTTGTTTITVKKNGTSIGTVTVTSATSATNLVYIGTSSGITASYVAGDVITYEWSDTGSPAGTGLHITNL